MQSQHYRLTAYQRLGVRTEALLVTDLRVEVDKPLDWVREHAGEIACRGIDTARFGQPIALWLTEERGEVVHGAQ